MKILIATDGSDFSNAAATEACEYLLRSEDHVRIVSAFDDSPIATEAYGMTVEYHRIAVDAVRKQSEESIKDTEAIVRRHPKGTDVDITTAILTGPAEREIVKAAERWRADIIVLGSHGKGFWGRQLLGSVSTGVMHHAPCSVLVVRKKS